DGEECSLLSAGVADDLYEVELEELTASIYPDGSANYLSVPTMRPRYRENSLNVNYVTQGNFNLCWAASVACIGEYITGIYKTAYQVANQMGIGFYDGATATQMKNAYSTIYGLNATKYTRASLTTSRIYGSIDNDKPVHGLFIESGGSMGHAVVIYGYYFDASGNCFVQYMNPAGSREVANFVDGNCFALSGAYAGFVSDGGLLIN
ncbi:MAG: C39 family peptidase, partial [Firmicutes bacterium]|nr:C39 family peptidase [Bacillota bacterium]